MTDQSNGEPAGSHTEDAATNRIASLLLRDEEKPELEQQPEPEPRGEPEGEQEQEGPEAEAPSEPEEPEYYDFERINPDTPLRLRDGTTVRFGDLKKDWASLQELPKQRQELEAAAARVHADMQKAAQQAQFFQQIVPQALQVMQSNLPQPPEIPERTDDPLENFNRWESYQRQKADYETRVGQIRQLQEAQHHHALKAQGEQQAQMRAYFSDQRQKLLNVVKDESKIAEIGNEIRRYAPEYWGFTPQEIEDLRDHRVVLLARDAIAYRKLQAEKPKAIEKVKQAPPVQQPGKRVSEAERDRQGYQEERAKLRKSGRADDAVALLAKHLR